MLEDWGMQNYEKSIGFATILRYVGALGAAKLWKSIGFVAILRYVGALAGPTCWKSNGFVAVWYILEPQKIV